jgi:Holliday junction resolvasome RuvABC endonuclease subunit
MMFQKAQYWPRMVERIPAEAREHLPHRARVEIATPAIIEGHIQRIEAAFATLRDQLRAFRPDVAALRHLFTFDSDHMRSGTGEVRAWIGAAAAMNRPAKVVEYVAAHCTQTGCGFVSWPPEAQG